MKKKKATTSSYTPNYRVGILGGGQLARMLILKAHEMGLTAYVLSPNPQDPAAQVTQNWIQGDPNQPADVKKIFSLVDIITFESEFIQTSHLPPLAKEHQVSVFPPTSLMTELRDRWTQKNWLLSGKIPTAEFQQVDSKEDLLEAALFFDHSFVLKKRLFGYDGYGTFVCRNKSDFKKMLKDFSPNPEGYIAEQFIPFKRELALMAARSPSGDITFLPLVETIQKDSKCFSVKGPVQHTKINTLKRKIKTQLESSQYVGVIAFELFDYKNQLTVNEVAPRVHNSAHYSLDALEDDQFTLHWKALLDTPLQPPHLKNKGFAMVNLIGSSNQTPQWTYPAKTHFHWYGKTDNRPGRKMGHLNVVTTSANGALKLALKSLERFQL